MHWALLWGCGQILLGRDLCFPTAFAAHCEDLNGWLHQLRWAVIWGDAEVKTQQVKPLQTWTAAKKCGNPGAEVPQCLCAPTYVTPPLCKVPALALSAATLAWPRHKVSFHLVLADNVPRCSAVLTWAGQSGRSWFVKWAALNPGTAPALQAPLKWMAAAELLTCCRTGLVAGQLLGYALGIARTPRALQMEDAPVTEVGFLWWMEPNPWTRSLPLSPSPCDSQRYCWTLTNDFVETVVHKWQYLSWDKFVLHEEFFF